MTRLETSGRIQLAGEDFEVKGWAWMDREWSTSVLEQEQVGWDWFSLQLDTGIEFMFYQMRRADGTVDRFSSGCWVDVDGSASSLSYSDVSVEILDLWENQDGDRYPSQWRITVPSRQTVLEVRPLLADQELKLSVRYWEGAVAVEGAIRDNPVEGKGYVELTGYADTTPWR
jgi:predicted secreted hydrolase